MRGARLLRQPLGLDTLRPPFSWPHAMLLDIFFLVGIAIEYIHIYIGKYVPFTSLGSWVPNHSESGSRDLG
jgi:hypothetical protein